MPLVAAWPVNYVHQGVREPIHRRHIIHNACHPAGPALRPPRRMGVVAWLGRHHTASSGCFLASDWPGLSRMVMGKPAWGGMFCLISEDKDGDGGGLGSSPDRLHPQGEM